MDVVRLNPELLHMSELVALQAEVLKQGLPINFLPKLIHSDAAKAQALRLRKPLKNALGQMAVY